MNIAEFVLKDELALITFSLYLFKEVERKIHNRTFFYKEQIDRYIDKKISNYLNSFSVSCALKVVYKQQIRTNVYAKLKDKIDENIHFSVCNT